MKNACVFLADGFEDIEAITPIDLLRRAGVSVTVVAVKGHEAVSARGLRVACDASLPEMLSKPLPDLAVLPGGGSGSRNLAASADLEKLVKKLFAEGKLVGAICAAPAVVLGSWGLLAGKKFTCFPGMGDDLPVKPRKERVVVDGNLVTSQAAGSAEEFSLALIAALCGKEAAEKVASEIHARR
jgi:4-methyl-5(b-hydroxyethyl)-thiazole monophosphate biosynthesis